MRTQSQVFSALTRQMLYGVMPRCATPAAPAIEPDAEVEPLMTGRFRERGSPYGLGIRLSVNSKYNPYIAHIHRDGRQINIGSYPTLAAAQQGQRLAMAGLPLRSGTKAGQVI